MHSNMLVVDDNVRTAENMSRMVSSIRPDWRFHVAGSCEKAREIFSSTAPDAAVLDKWLPDGDGLDLMQEVKAIYPRVPVIFMTGDRSDTLVADAYNLGAYSFMEKPFSIEALVMNMEQAVLHSMLKFPAGNGKEKELHEQQTSSLCALPQDRGMELFREEDFLLKILAFPTQ